MHVPRKPAAFGFLAVNESAEAGFVGGYLLLNDAGRPLEFHCTAPVRPTRAQEILYGPTLRSYLVGERIAHALVSKSKLSPDFVCVDSTTALSLRALVDFPVVHVQEDDDGGPKSLARFDGPHSPPAPRSETRRFDLNSRSAAVSAEFPNDQTLVLDRFASVADRLDLSEPFGRVREALAEAQRGPGK